jgi:hypothetical protein
LSKQFEAYPCRNRVEAIEWMAENQEALNRFEQLCQEAIDLGHRKFGIDLIRERYRWESPGDVKEDGFKFKNNHSPYITRYFFSKHPEWRDFITWRRVADELGQDGVILITQREIDEVRERRLVAA